MYLPDLPVAIFQC